MKRLNEGLDRLVKGLLLGQFRHRGCQLQFPCQKRWVTVWEPGVGLSWGRAELAATPPSHLFTLLGLPAHLGKGPA